MKKITIPIVLGLLCFYFSGVAQKYPPDGLTIGDKMPDVALHDLLNYKKSSLRLSELTGKLVILDFWATWCSNCIANFPATEKLQKEFGKQILVLGVAYEPTSKIRAFFKRAVSPDGKAYNFPCVTADQQLSKLFPHQALPHYVWIGPDGIVKAITGADEINAANIRKLLQTGTVHTILKADLNPDRPLFLSEQVVIDSLQHYALLYHHNYDGLVTTRRLRQTNGITRGVALSNQPIISVFETAFDGLLARSGEHYYANRCIIESKDSLYLKSGLWNVGNNLLPKSSLYNYDLIVPLAAADSLYETMLQDLNSNSPYQASLESRELTCLVLRRTSERDKLKSAAGKPVRNMGAGQPLVLQNAPLNVFISWLNTLQPFGTPVFDETGYAEKIDIQLPAASEPLLLKNALAAYDLILVPERRKVGMFVIRDHPVHQTLSKPQAIKP